MALNNKYSYIAFYDLDHTILKVNSANALVRNARWKGIIGGRYFRKAIWLSLRSKYGSGHTSESINKMLSWLDGIDENKILELCRQVFHQKQVRKIRKEIVESMELHRSSNAAVVMLSSATDPICELVANYLKMDDVICSQLEVRNGAFTGRTSGPLVFGEEKRKQLLEYCKANGYDPGESYYYGDSFQDRFVMEAVGHPVAVRPDKRLNELAKKKKWSSL